MHDEAGFLSAIRESPPDDTARLVFADWLDEQDDPTCKTKAAFIRLELQLAEAPEDAPGRSESLVQLRSLAAEAPPSWLAVVGHAKLEGCRRGHTCPGRWELLTPTSFDDIRRCRECKKAVRFCSTLAYARPWAQDANCVAISPAVERQPGDLPVRLGRTLEMIARVRIADGPAMTLTIAPPPPAPSAPAWVPAPQPEGRSRVRRRPKRKKGRHEHRNIQRDNWEDAE
jgi:uncharacterized protein (TIGR02996 family)